MALAVKKAIVEEDDFELNHRKALNYGHTVGHTLEAMSGFRIPHGMAVVAGIIVANELSSRRGLLKNKEKTEIKKLSLDLLDLSLFRNLRLKDLKKLLKKDKKSTGEIVNFVMK
jgi:3-dehydroquinate synthase